MICDFFVFITAGPAKIVKRQIKSIISFFVPVMIFQTVIADIHAFFGCANFRRRTMLISPADIQDLMPGHSHKPGINI